MTNKSVKCPTCRDAEEIRRSHLRLRDLPFLLIGMRAYRCLLCYHRFHTWKRVPTHLRVRKVAENGSA